MKRRILAFFIVLVLAGFTLGMKIAAHPSVDQWLRKTIIDQARKHLGVNVQLGKLDRNIFLTRLTLNDVTLRDLTGSGNSISLSRLAVEVDPYAFFRGKILIKDLKLEGMYLDIVRREDGTVAVDPLFPFWQTQRRPRMASARLGFEIGNVTFLNVDLAFRDIPAGANVNLDGVNIFLTRNRFDPPDRRSVNLRAKQGEVKWRVFPEGRAVAIDSLYCDLAITRDELRVSELSIKTGPINLELSGNLPFVRNAVLSGNLSIVSDIGKLPWLIPESDGIISLDGIIGGDLSTPSFRGQLRGRDVSLAGREMENIGADVYLDTRGSSLTAVTIEYRGEELSAEADVRFRRTLPFNMSISTQKYPLQKILMEVGADAGGINGYLGADLMIEGRLSGGESVITMRGNMAVPLGKNPLLLDFDLSGSYGEKSLNDLLFTASSRSAKLVVRGTLADTGPMLDLFITDEDLASWPGIPGLGDVEGSLVLSGNAAGRWENVRTSFDLELVEPSFKGFRADLIEAHADMDRKELSLPMLTVKAGSTVLVGRASIPFSSNYEKPWINISVADGRIEDILNAADIDFPAGGELDGNLYLSLSGTGWESEGRLSARAGRILLEPFDEITLEGNLTEKVFTARRISVLKDGRLLEGSGSIQGSRYRANVRSLDPILIEGVEYLKKISVPLAGEVAISGEINGDLKSGDLRAKTDLNWEQITYDGRSWRSGRGTFQFDRSELQAHGVLLDGELIADVSVDLREVIPFSGSIYTPSTIDRTGLNDFLGLRIPGNIVSGRISVRADADGILTNVNRTNVEGVISDADITINGIRLNSRDQIPFNYFPETGIRFSKLALRSGGSSIDGTLRIAPDAGIDGSVDGSIDLEGLTFLEPTVDSFNGQALTRLKVAGSLSEPILNGSIELSDTRCMAHLPFDLPISELSGKLEIVGNRLHIGRITGSPSGGSLQMTGELFLKGFRPVQGSLLWEAEAVPIQFPKGLETVNRGVLGLKFSEGRGFLRGTINMDRGSYTRNVDINNLIALLGESDLAGDTQQEEETANEEGKWLNLDVEMVTASPVQVDLKLVRGEASGNLHLRGTAASPTLTGRLEMTEGIIEYRGQSFEITSGTVSFLNTRVIEPSFDFSGRTEVTGFDREGLVTDYTVELLASGVPEKFRLNLVSSPELSETDIISLLTWGAVGEQAFASRGGLSATEATLLLTRELKGRLETEVEKVTGFDRFTINPSTVSSSGERTTRIQVDKKLSEKFYLTYSTPILASEEQEVQVKYRITRSLSLIGEQLGERDYGLDLDFTFEIP